MVISAKGTTRRGAFSLVELVIVIVIIGVIGAIPIPRVTRGANDAGKNAFIRDLKVFIQAAELYTYDHQAGLPDSTTGELPNAAFGDYIVAASWTGGTPIGGQWDTEANGAGGFTSALGVHFMTGGAKSDDFMTDLDADLDDGDLTTGRFRKVGADRFYWILAD